MHIEIQRMPAPGRVYDIVVVDHTRRTVACALPIDQARERGTQEARMRAWHCLVVEQVRPEDVALARVFGIRSGQLAA